MHAMRRSIRVLFLLASLVLAGCVGTPAKEAPAGPPASSAASSAASSERAAAYAAKMVGKPYRFGGASPSSGFDCSGLVQYSYARAGLKLPHNTEAQWRMSKAVRRSQLRRGDLIFFNEKGGPNSHVGIYLGDGTFVHAPSSGKSVRRDRLDAAYWRKHLSGTRRIAA